MRNRFNIFVAASIVAATLFAADVPPTARGHSDLSGTYNVATRTPLQRPRALADKKTLTKEEAQAIARKEVEIAARADAATDPERGAPQAGGAGFAGDLEVPELDAAAGEVGGYNWFWIDRGSGAFQIDGQYRTSIIVDPPNGRYPPLTDEGKRRAAARGKMYRKNNGTAWWIEAGLNPGPYDDPELRPLAERCLLGFGSTSGPPMMPVLYNNLKRIVQTEGQIMILNEMVHDVRIIRMNARHVPSDVRKWMGDSVGHWEGDTLVVDTTNFTDQPALGGASRDLHVIERFRRVDANTIVYKFTVDDPTIWTSSWSGEYVWPASDQRVYEYACHEGSDEGTSILGEDSGPGGTSN